MSNFILIQFSNLPFLEKELVDFAFSTPSEFKVIKGEVKYILKETVKDILPKLIYERNNKVGYATPMGEWFSSSTLNEVLETELKKTEQPLSKFISVNYVIKCWEEHKTGSKDHSGVLWKYLYLSVWHKTFFK